MSKNLKLLMDALQNEGMRYTKQRKLVWDEICRSKEHRDAEEIYLKPKSFFVSNFIYSK